MSDYSQQNLSVAIREPQILDMLGFKNDTDSSLLTFIINTFK
jgi:hypothetical protein